MPYGPLDPTAAEAAPVLTIGAPLTSTGKTLDGMLTELVLQLVGRTDIDPARITTFLNDAYIDLATSLKLPELNGTYTFETVIGQHLYLLPTQMFATYGAAIVDPVNYSYYGGQPLDKIDLDAYRGLPDRSDQPENYFLHSGMIVLWPTPNAIKTIAVDFQARPLPLAANTDSPVLGVEWHEIIQKMAREKAFEAVLEFQLAALMEASWTKQFARKKDPLAAEDTGRLVGSSVPRTLNDLKRRR